MTKTQALARARIELGKGAHVEDRGPQPEPHPYRRHRYIISKVTMFGKGANAIGSRDVLGEGATWDEAFAALERRRHGVDVRLLHTELSTLIELLDGEISTQAVLDLRTRLLTALAVVAKRDLI